MVSSLRQKTPLKSPNLIFTIVFLAIQLIGLIVSINLVIGPPICDGPCSTSVGSESGAVGLDYYLPHILINGFYGLTLIAATIVSILRIRARKTSYWIPMVAIGVNIAFLITCVIVIATLGPIS